MRTGTVRTWCWVHKWTSLVCTLFLLMLCLTGLPLIFHDEIDAAFDDRAPLATLPANAPKLPLDAFVRTARAMYPGERPLFISFDEDRPVANVTTATVARPGRGAYHLTAIDRRTAKPVGALDEEGGIMAVILRLHVDMFAGLPGKLFLGFMGLLFCMSIVSGIVVYAPFMRKLAFGEVRRNRSRRVRWLDLHNLFGIATATWIGVVGLTGVINTLSEPLTAIWRADQLTALTRPYAGEPPLPVAAWGSLDQAVRTARAAAPSTDPQFVAFPGTRFSSEHHYAVWLKGATPATRQLLTPALIDAHTGRLTAMRSMPWYMLALRLSQPLHFGNYGAMPMKILWALLDLVAILILGSGLYLWLSRKRTAS
ncbi:Uncharacterized iron-regulated membrane protein [Sphingomonas gellani]|uniref:Uncharacterized iron-regulated membrane protein n=1 Tax=Sphingomonas gellani TaxID=1166340 RepID=A0A1H8ATQ4_9SPHN|nr:PepSY domain-containing protein [Sphingomonas gellani]SEM74171.1 Uncharacterized iron-regulated membrane protein [Sphingomonas gellani]